MSLPRRTGVLSRLMLVGVACWPGVGGCLTTPGGLGPGESDPSSKPVDGCVARVYLIRGLWDVFSTGLNTLGDELRRAGINAVVISGADWPALRDELIAQAATGVTTPLVLIGHSYGADDAIEVARQLRRHDIPVALLGLIDATDPGRIAANVDRCVHLYLPNPLGLLFPNEFSGNPVFPAADNTHSVIENITVTRDNFGAAVNGVDHFNIESNAAVHVFMLGEVRAICVAAEAEAE